MPPAVIGGVIAGAGAIGSAVIGSKSASKAAKAQSQAADQSAAVQREIYNKNVGFQTPYLNTGNAAMAQINALLGLNVPQAPAPSQTLPGNETQTPAGGGGGLFSNLFNNSIVKTWQQRIASGEATIDDAPPLVRQHIQALQQQQAQTPASTVPAVTQPTAQAAYDQFKNYTGYTSRLQEGQNAINSGYAARGTLQSGAALQALQEHGQQFASNEFGNYMGYLGGQQQLGPGAANALAGVGTNYANAASNIAMQRGENAANAAIAQGNIWGNAINGVAGAAGQIFGGTSFSDERLKKDIVTLYVRPDGLPVKEWTWNKFPGEGRVRGFVAQDVRDIYPEAFIENYFGTGFHGVDYGKIPHMAEAA